MLILYVCPVVIGFASLWQDVMRPDVAFTVAASANLMAWAIMTVIFFPIVRWYRVSGWKSAWLPASGFLYVLLTVSSALRFWAHRADAWKGRA